MISMLIRLGLLALFITGLSGCSGSDGSAGPAGAAGAPGANGSSAGGNAATMTPQQWADAQLVGTITGVDMSKGTPVVSFKVTDASGNPITGLGQPTKSTAASTIVTTVNNLGFKIAKLVPGANGSPSKWVNYIVTGNPTLCVPTAPATTCAAPAAASGVVNAGQIIPAAPAKPSNDSTGTLVDNGDGTYKYTFYRDITTMSAYINSVASSVKAANVLNDVTDLGDLTYNSSLTHRVGIEISGNARGTGTNTPDGSTSTIAAVAIKTPVNVFYDFVPSTGTAIAVSETDGTKQRNIVDVRNCFTCHGGKFAGIHGGSILTGVGGARQDTRMCVMCHTDQRKYSTAPTYLNAAGTGFTTGANNTTGTTERMPNNGGFSIKTFPQWIHKIHMGENLVLTGYNTNVTFDAKFPQDLRNCTKCHSDNDVATNNTAVTGAPGWVSKVPQADNWKNNPSRLACGACHDGVNYNTGTAITLNGLMTVHGGGVQADDSMCATCHTAAVITTYHQPVSPIDPTFATNSHTNSSYIAGYNSTNLPSGALKISYDLNSVTLNASRNPVLRFRFMNNSVSPAVPVVFNDNSGVNPPLPSQSTSTTIVGIELMPNFVGGPNAYVMAAVPQDGTTPADFNASASAYIRNCWNKINAATTCTMTADGTTGYYILTMTGTVMPTNAAMIYGGIGFNDGGSTTSMPLTQSNATLDAADIPGYTALTVTTNASGFATGWKGGLNVPATPVTKLVTCGTATSTKACAPTASTPVLLTGFTAAQTTAATTARRQIVEKARCDNCHNSLGTFTFASFHGGQRNDPDRCVLCHDANRTNNGWQIASNAHVHAIHSAYKRTADNGPLFTWTATDAAGLSVGAPVNGFFEIGYPGILRNCQQCHLPNTVNFGNTANAAAANNGTMAFKTACSGTMTAGTTMSPYVTAGQNCGTGFSTSLATGATTQAAGATLVNSPIANACFSCHTLPTAMSHMRANGGSLYAPRWVVAGRVSAADFDLAASGVAGGLPLPNAEQCPVCHGQGRVADAELIHAQTMKPVYNPQ